MKTRMTIETHEQYQRSLSQLSLIAFLVAMTVIMTLTGCSTNTNPTFTQEPVVVQPLPIIPRMGVQPATLQECPAGGTDITMDDQVLASVCNGISGSNGLPGLNGTTLEFIQFCPGTPVYPSTFPEVGIQVGSSVYAVYSANGGFLTYLPPGLYQSTGIGNGEQCQFTVNSDGTVSR